ncbi:hypothetical protein Asulf_01965 [Archaeoglobus sulfaticallidus PM70-1]|uniref:Uncharacterized protein n=1 Tax=Archaeoglobus sulfaticallidus PM70-1 TaxID=387631 RepID=N0BMT7_9EURY|nr:hypothetical protein [Archaeoglobus sulfaticallidus]AGK61931.1 hypothetical protein Asulf_01965 [Archaeoglobus sulfaticallidus PM70-1]
MRFGGGEITRRFYINIALSLLSGFIIFFWGYGLYEILTTFQIYFRLSYILLAFTIAFIFFTAFLEHRGVEIPYLFVSSALLASLFTFIGLCIVNGVISIYKSFPPIDNFLIMFSISIIVGFIFIKMVFTQQMFE